MEKENIGSSFDDFLKEDGVYEEVSRAGKIKSYIHRSHQHYLAAGEYRCPSCHGTGTTANIVDRLMRIVEELGKASAAWREGRVSPFFFYDGEIDVEWFESEIKYTFQDHIAATLIRLFDVCGWLKIEPEVSRVYSPFRNANVGDVLLKLIGAVSNSLDSRKIDNPISMALDICRHLNIPIEKHIEARLAYLEASR